jgi:hypothetical protein
MINLRSIINWRSCLINAQFLFTSYVMKISFILKWTSKLGFFILQAIINCSSPHCYIVRATIMKWGEEH